VPELLNNAISALMAAISFFPALNSAAALLVDEVGDHDSRTTLYKTLRKT
jgi:hypothetical protein